MAKSLIIVESPTKARTISRFLGSKYHVEASMGHVRDLPKSKLGVDVEHSFAPTYTIPTRAKEVIAKLKKLAKGAPEVILATDEDREGESISWHLAEALGLSAEESKRIVFHEITKPAIEAALLNPRHIDQRLVDAQQARRVLDRLVGYELSPFLWHKVRYGLSAGRVQSVAVRLVVEREREIEAFKAQEYWTVEAELSKEKDDKRFPAKLNSIDGKAVGKLAISSEAEAKAILKELEGASYAVAEVGTKTVSRNPSPPFTTSTLQQEAARKLGYSAQQTMMVAQQLYEGIELGADGHQGLITYMRTDSLNLAESALAALKNVIADQFGKEYALAAARSFTNRSKGAQEAHEAIRPTDVTRRPDQVAPFLDSRQRKLYDLIWKRTVACQMQPAELEQTSVDIAAGKRHAFRATGQVVKFDGFIRAYTEGQDEKAEDEIEGVLPELSKGDLLDLKSLSPLQHFTEPPARYTDATLIKALEAHGVGRPSTYAPTLATIQARDYVTKEEKRYQPTEIGTLVNDLLVENFPEIVDVGFTSHVEAQLDNVAEGNEQWEQVCREFYGPFKKHLLEKEASVEKQVEISDTPCPHCGKPMLVKFGRTGKFLACPEPGSKVTQPMPEEAAEIARLSEKTKGELCPICGKPMVVKRGRFGYFLGCVDYPTCKGISKIWNKTGFKCPHCQVGDIVERKGRGRGKPFFGCNRFPACTFLMNVRPESEAHVKEVYGEWIKAGKDKEPAKEPRRPYGKKKEKTE